MTVNDRTDEFLENVTLQAATNLLEAAFYLQAGFKDKLSTSYPPASTPGQYPHGRTWGGRDAVVVQPSTPEEITQTGYVRIGFLKMTFDYMTYLSFQKGRLGLLHCYAEMKPQLEQIINQGSWRWAVSSNQ